MIDRRFLLEFVGSKSDQFQYYVCVIYGTCLVLCFSIIFYAIRKPQIIWKKRHLAGCFNGKTRTLKDFLSDNLPTIFHSETHLVAYYWNKLSENHFYSLFPNTADPNGGQLVRLDHCFELLFHFIFLFSLSLVIVIFLGQPRFGYNACSGFHTANSCLNKDNVQDWFKMCQWNHIENTCFPKYQFSMWPLRVFCISSMICSVGASISYGVIHPVVQIVCHYFAVTENRDNQQIFPEVDIEESKQSSLPSLSEYDDELCKLQCRKGVMLKAVRCQLMHKCIDFVPPKRELQELLHPNSKVRAWKQSPQSFDGSINICNYVKYQFQVWKHYCYSIGNPDLAYEAINQLRIHRPDVLVQRLRESRKKSEEIRFQLMNSSLSDRDRDALLFRYFVGAWFSGCDQLICEHLLIHPFISLPKKFEDYSPFMLHKVVFFFLVVIILSMLTVAASLAIRDPLSTILCLGSTGVAHIIYSFVVLPFRILFVELLLPQIICNKVLKLFKVLQVRLKYITKRESGLLVRVQSLIQHFHPACRTARLLPWLPMSRILIALNDFDLPTSTYKEWKPTYRVFSSNTGSPLIVDFCEVVSHNMGMRIFYAFFRLLHYFLMVVKLLLNGLLSMPCGLRFATIDILLTISVYGSALLVLTQTNLGIPGVVIGILFACMISCFIHAFQWYWWYPYIRRLWDNDWFSPKRKRYVKKKPKKTIMVKTFHP